MRDIMAPAVFDYTDYRKYLVDYFKHQKAIKSFFSHRYFSNKAGLTSSNFLLLVMRGERNITPSLCCRISQAIKHSATEAVYFENMVNFNQAKTSAEKDRFYSRLITTHKQLKIQKIEDWQYEYYSKWFNPVIRELVVCEDFDGNLAALSRRLSPSITPAQAKKSLTLLLRLGLIIKHGKKFIQSSPFLSTGPEIQSVALANFHKTTALFASEAIDKYPKSRRNISSCTINISEEVYHKLVDKINEVRKEVLSIAESSGKSDRVYQVNFHLFPLTKIEKSE